MGSPITLSGFNSIDFNLVLTSIMTQESRPLVALQSRQAALESKATSFGTLATRVSTLQQAASTLSTGAGVSGFAATSNDTSAVSVSAGSSAAAGRYEVVVSQLARAQVTASVSDAPDTDTTVVASAGTLTIGGVTVTLAGSATLRQLADAINATSDPPAHATVVQSGPSSYRLVITAKDTGAANAFTITNNLTGGTGIAFGANAVDAADASLTVNNIPITSATNVIEEAVPGVTISLLKQDPAATVVVDVAADTDQLLTKVQDFITAYNDLVKFATDQAAAAGGGDPSSIGRDPVLRQLRNELRAALSGGYATGNDTTALSQVGIEFTRTGTLELDEATFEAAATTSAGRAAIEALFVGTPEIPGAFASIGSLLDTYSQVDGLLPGAQKLLTDQASRLSQQIASLQDRLAVRRATLQREFIAADLAMTQLKSQSGSLAAFGAEI